LLFNSWSFVVLLTVTWTLYYLPPFGRLQIPILVAASFVFYGAHKPILLLLLIASIFINAVTSHRVYYGPPRWRRAWAAAGVGTNLGILLFFKYSGLFYRTFISATPTDHIGAWLLTLPLPIGISFFTFQGISLVVDTYRSKKDDSHLVEVHPRFATHLVVIAFFKAFFPQLVSGPIVKAHQFLPQIAHKKLRDIRWDDAFRALVIGFFLKSVVADNLRTETNWLSFPAFETWSSASLLAMLFGYSMQIFADFAGYSLIAIGVALLFGYQLPINFSFPYISASFSEFWTRWHISLSSWLREYLYVPLGGNRRGALRTYLNLAIVMFLGGLWHGATWSYAIWGSWHGALLAIERALGANRASAGVARVVRIVIVFSLVTGGWLLFKLPHFGDVIAFGSALRHHVGLPHHRQLMLHVALYSAPVIVYHLHHLWTARRGAAAPGRRSEVFALGMMMFLLLTNMGNPGAFIYFQF
jgi:alginate O-acetyltransferase complex protein AlgI